MEMETYITEEERIRCRKVAEAYAELYEGEDIVVLDAGKYGFVKLQYYALPFGFDEVTTFRDSLSLFEDLWNEWLQTRLIDLSKGTPLEDRDYDYILKWLPEDKRREIWDKRAYFAEKAHIATRLA